ncbi:MAG: hypothetical protein SFZ24_03195 [Planctomycetota bacterium]|nr:hypothetical protein [Planctomycetota bacterium]
MRILGLRPSRVALLVATAGLCAGLASADAPVSNSVESAQALLEQGRIVEAKSMLLDLRKASGTSPDARLIELLAAADRRLVHLGEAELSLQKAELALSKGELRVAETHAAAAKRSAKATDQQTARADKVISEAKAQREQLTPLAPSMLAQAASDMAAGRFPEAKAGLSALVRTGVPLSQEQMAEVNRHQDRIYQLERQQGNSFESAPLQMSVMAAPAAAAVAASAVAAPQTDAPASSPPPAPAGDALLDETMRIDAERLVLEAEAAFQAGRYNEAIEKFTRAINIYGSRLSADQRTLAEDRLADARALIGAPQAGLVENVAEQKRLMREEAEATFNNLVAQAEAALARGDVPAARNLGAQARLTWNNAQASGVFSEQQYRAGIERADALLRAADERAEAITRAEIEQRGNELRQEEARTRSEQEQERRRRINENLDRLRALQVEHKYEEALQVAEQVLFLDPTNSAALLLKDVLRDVILYREFEEVRRERAVSVVEEALENQRSLIIPRGVMNYPADWPEISFRRGEQQAFMESEADRRVLATLDSRRVPASFRDNTLEDVVTFLATVTNLNVDVDWDSLAQIGIERDRPISLELREVPARVVLERVLEKAQPDAFSKAGWAVQDGVLVIAADEALRRNTFIVIYDIRDLLFQVPDFTDIPELDLDQVLQQARAGGGGGGGSVFSEEDDSEPEGPTEEELRNRILDIIQTNVDFGNWVDQGGSTGVVQELNGNLIITNTARNHRQIQGLLNQLREIRSVQISVEGRFLSVNTQFFERLAFDLDIYFNAQNEQFESVDRQLTDIQNIGVGAPNEGRNLYPVDLVGRRQVVGSGYQRNIDPATGAVTYTPVGATGTAGVPLFVPRPSPLSVIPFQQQGSEAGDRLMGSSPAASGLVDTFFGATPLRGLGIAGTFLDDVQVDFLIEATQADQRTVSLSAPRLTFSNGRSANIVVARTESFIGQLTPVVGAGAVAFNPTPTPLTIGVTLGVRGVVSADRRYVTLTIQTGLSSEPDIRSVPVSATAGGTGTGPGAGIATGFIELPSLSVSRVNTAVTIPDRGTVLLGGSRAIQEFEFEVGVPVLSQIPIINRFFTNRGEAREDTTLMILLKPTVIIQSEEEEKNFPGLLDKLSDPLR